MIYIFPVLRMDTNIGHIKTIMAIIDQIAIMATMAYLYISIDRADIGVYAKNRKNVNHQLKTEMKYMHQFKNYGQNKINWKIKTIACVV